MSDLISSIALKRSALPPPARRLNKYNTLILHDSHYTGPLLKTSFLADQFTSGRQTLPGINNTLILRTLYKRMGNTKKPTPGVRGNASVGNLNFLNVRNACFWYSGRFLVDSLHYWPMPSLQNLKEFSGDPPLHPIFLACPPPLLKHERSLWN